ncbi:hypothetical protein [Marinobacter shengliensis]
MKIIRPIDLTQADVFSSNAPADGYAQWQTIGRNFLTSISDLVIACNQTTLFAVNESPSFSKTLYAFDLDTGSDVALAFTLSNFDIKSMAASPDGQYLALAGYKNGSYSPSNAELRVYNLSTGTMLFSRQARVFDGISWSYDSAAVGFIGHNSAGSISPVIVAAGSWGVQSDISDVPSMFRENPDGYFGHGYGFDGFVVDGHETYYSLSTSELYQSGGPPTMAIRKSIIGKLSTSGSNSYVVRLRVEGPSSSTIVSSPVHLVFNPVKSHVLGYLGQTAGFVAFDGATLAADSDVPAAPDAPVLSITPSLDGQEFVVTNSSVQPYLRKFSSTSYTQTGSLDAEVGGFTDNIRYSADYIVFGAPEGGYGLIDIATGDRVTQVNPSVTEGDIFTYGQHNYRALLDNNDRPDLGVKSSPPTWADLGFINPLRMVDGKVGSLTQSPSPLVIEITSPDLIDGVAMFGLEASTVQAELLDGETVLFDTGEESLLDSSMINGWYSHFFTRRGVRKDFVLTSLPPYRGATLRITITSTDEVVRIGELVAGQVRKLGDLLFGSSFGIEDWSRKERNIFGEFEVIERGFSKRGDYQVSIRTNQISWIQQLLAGLRATPVVYIGDESQQLSIIYGFYVVLDLVVEMPVYSQCRIEVEGLTDDSATN